MKLIDRMTDKICEELEGAWEYTEKFIENRAKGNPRWTKYKEMAMDESHHAENIYEFAVSDLESLQKVYSLSAEEEEKWEHMIKKFAEQVSVLKNTLSR